ITPEEYGYPYDVGIGAVSNLRDVRARLFAPENRKWWTLTAVTFGLFMIMLDNTVVNVALPSMQDDLGISHAGLEWVVKAYALISTNHHAWTSTLVLSMFAVAAVALVIFVLLELHQRIPMLDMSLFRNATFAGANAVMLLTGVAMFGIFFFNSLMFQRIIGWSAIQTGAIFLPMTVLIMFVAPAAGKFSDRVGSRWLMAAGMLLLTGSLLAFAQIERGSNFWDVLPALLLGGVGMALVMTPTTAAAMGSVSVEKAGVGSAVINSMRQVGGSLGIAVMGAVVATQ